mmetsp:Transcript_11168/g.34448  ORF Transcript_11168/g.34448 Transcript_11168/m.34448 type:complete len:126 (+) Transcript_11168:1-378(+)
MKCPPGFSRVTSGRSAHPISSSTPSRIAPPSPIVRAGASPPSSSRIGGACVKKSAASSERPKAKANQDEGVIFMSELQEVVPVRQFGYRRKSVVTCPASPLLRRGNRAGSNSSHTLSAGELASGL